MRDVGLLWDVDGWTSGGRKVYEPEHVGNMKRHPWCGGSARYAGRQDITSSLGSSARNHDNYIFRVPKNACMVTVGNFMGLM